MRAAVLSRHDLDGLTLQETAEPTPGEGEVLVRVDTVGVNQLDLNVIAGIGPGAQAQLPRILGIDPAGEIVAVGAGVDRRRIGQAVVVKPNIACGTCAHCLAGDEANCPKQTVIGCTATVVRRSSSPSPLSTRSIATDSTPRRRRRWCTAPRSSSTPPAPSRSPPTTGC